MVLFYNIIVNIFLNFEWHMCRAKYIRVETFNFEIVGIYLKFINIFINKKATI